MLFFGFYGKAEVASVSSLLFSLPEVVWCREKIA